MSSSKSALLRSSWLAACITGLVAACTFYTQRPETNNAGGACSCSAGGGSGGSAGAKGGASNQGGKDGGGSDSGGAGGNGGEGAEGGAPVEPADWTDATGSLIGKSNGGGNVVYVAAKPSEDMLIAGLVGNGLWVSRDGGDTWNGLGQTGSSDIITNGVSQLLFDPGHSDVFWEVGIYNGPGLYVTRDDGKTIRQLGIVHFLQEDGTVKDALLTHIESVSVDFSDRDRKTMVAGQHEGVRQLYYSSDAGQNWDPIGEGIPPECGFSSYPLVIDRKTFLLGCVSRIVRTEDGGATWSTVSFAGGQGLPVVHSDGSIYWVIDGGNGLMKSSDNGQTWTRILGSGILLGPLLELPDGRLAARSDRYVIVSGDGGSSWTIVSTPAPFGPKGLAYSAHQKAFYTWIDTQDAKIPANSIMKYHWDYERERNP